MSSHMPWNRIPEKVGWNQVGNGSIYNHNPEIHETGAFWSNPPRVQAAYGKSIVYSLNTPDLVRAALRQEEPRDDRPGRPPAAADRQRGSLQSRRADLDHRPRPEGAQADRQLGLGSRACSPKPNAPVWPMSAFRNRFLDRVRLATGDPVARRELPRRPARQRLAGLDGLRGLAALYVVVNHVFLRAFPGYPVDHAPFWAGWFIYGRFAVVVFIVLSGFSLALSPARHGWRLDKISAVRAAAGLAHPAGVLGRARLQPRGGVADRSSARARGARREIGRRQRAAGAEHRRRAQPQRGVLVDGRRGPAVPACSRCCC